MAARETAMTYLVRLTSAERGLVLHALMDQILRKDDGGIEVYHDVVNHEEATPGDLIAKLLAWPRAEED